VYVFFKRKFKTLNSLFLTARLTHQNENHKLPGRVTELTPRCFNCGKVGHSTGNCFYPKRLAAMSLEQRNVGRGFRKDFQQSSQNSQYRNVRAGSDSNETPWVKKGCHPNHGYNFVNSWLICKILSLLQTAVKFQQNPYRVTHHTLSMLLHYLGKLKNQKFALCMRVIHVSCVIFYHLSKRYLPNVMKICAKINTMQNINILLFVRSLSMPTSWTTPQSDCRVLLSLDNSGLSWTAPDKVTAVPVRRNGNSQTPTTAVRPKQCHTLSNPAHWQDYTVACTNYTLQTMMLLLGWPVMALKCIYNNNCP